MATEENIPEKGQSTMKSSRPIRGRDMLSNSNSSSPSAAVNLYEHQGDSEAALAAYRSISSDGSFSQAYNKSLLSYLSTNGRDKSFIDQMEDFKKLREEEAKTEGIPERKKKRKEYILLFNECLILFVAGKLRDSATRVLVVLRPLMEDKTVVHEDLLNVTSRMAFLVLDCMLSMSEGSRAGLIHMADLCSTEPIITWLEAQKLDSNPQLKFLVQIYKSRIDFAQRDPLNGKIVDAKVRGVKKELKQAMELFNHKIRSTGEAGSLGSLSDLNSDVGDGGSYTNQKERNQRERIVHSNIEVGTQEGLLQAHHQAALNLKAQLEQLKGNTKKSLILCTEARTTHNDPSYESLDANNLAIVYATSSKRHLALHTTSKALRAPNGGQFRVDGTARSDTAWSILANTSLCALQAHRYVTAYECMATCVQNSPIYHERPRCWLRMAEACIGMHTEQSKERNNKENNPGFSVVEEDGKPVALVAQVGNDAVNRKRGGSNARLGSREDMEYVAKFPLQQASFCLDKVMKLLRDASVGAAGSKMDGDCLESARCAQAYVLLELKVYKQALFLAKLILMDTANRKETSGLHGVTQKRRRATAAMYACEACCALGDAVGALKFLTGEKEEDSVLDRLAVDLAGVDSNSYLSAPSSIPPDVESRRKARVKHAQAMVRTSASAATAAMGRLGMAKQLAMSAISLEENAGLGASAEAHRNTAKKALLYCMLREGNRDGALAVLRSSR